MNYYIWLRGWEALAFVPSYRLVYTVVFVCIAAAWFVGRFLERWDVNRIGAVLVYGGSFWLAAMVYFYFSALFIDVIRLADHFSGFLPAALMEHGGIGGFITMLVVTATVGIAVVAGHINALNPRIRKFEFDIPKKAGSLNELSIAVASDIHLGTIICQSRLRTIIEKINSLNADIVLLPGDVIDEDLKPVIRQNLGEMLLGIRSKYGVFAITGNHEYIGGVEPAVEYLVAHGLVELRDEVVKIADAFYIAGREDLSIKGFTGNRRKPLRELLKGVDKALPIILMDHQPNHLEEAEENGVDLQLSGHTHHGQIWPFNYLTKKIYEVSWGYKKKGNTHIYVSCGVGSWGPPVRLANSPEIISITLRFTGK